MLAAKNLILAGPKSVTLWDPTPVTPADLGKNYYIRTSDMGKGRAESCVEALSELNPYVSVHVARDAALTPEVLARFHLVVMTDRSREEAIRVNAFCREQTPAIGFIAADVRGVAGYTFVDFGDAHVMRDASGEAVKSAIITQISRSNPATVYTVDTKRHGFSEGDYVIFREVAGMTELNDGKARKIISAKQFSFVLEEDTSSFGEHTVGGLVEQTRVPVDVKYGSLAERITSPIPSDDPLGMFITPDLGKFGRPDQLHIAFQAVEDFRGVHGALPTPHNKEHADEVVALAKTFLSRVKGAPGAPQAEEVEESVIRKVAMTAAAELPALAAFFGGIVAQEVVKFTGKFTPLRQWLYLDAFEILPTDFEALPAAEFSARGNRYDNASALIGHTAQAKVMDQRVFVVGAGALGCEFLKNFAMMGVGCGPKGHVTVTDMDRIEVSNLNRQFLFRSANVGKPKSITAAAAAQAMNSDMKVEALETPVGEDTEGTFNDAFWEQLDVVTNALDNLKARSYVDGRCIFYGKPLLESGTLGTKANTQVVIPRLTECYTDSVDPPEESIPMCTLRNFPHAIEHCIEWARDLFAGSFTNTVQEAAAFVANPAAWFAKISEEGNLSARRTKLEGVLEVVTTAHTANWETCVRAARLMFHNHFYIQLRQLLHNFPPEYADPATGVKFWSPPKRLPVCAIFDVSDPVHFSFVTEAAALLASNYGLTPPLGFDTHAVMDPIIASIDVPEFVPKSQRIKASETDTTEEGADDDGDAIRELTAKLNAVKEGVLAEGKPLALAAAEFEKDDDTNHHIDFITAASNLRARNYTIREATRFDVKLTAGRIIPAIATTTCAVTGLVCIEVYKVIFGMPVEAIRNSFINLGINMYSMAEPAGPKRTKTVDYDPITLGPIKAVPEGFTRWDRVIIRPTGSNMTPGELDAWLGEHHKCKLSMISCGKLILFNPLLYRNHAQARTTKPIKTILEEVSGEATPDTKKYLILDVSAEDDDGDVIIPQVQLYLV